MMKNFNPSNFKLQSQRFELHDCPNNIRIGYPALSFMARMQNSCFPFVARLNLESMARNDYSKRSVYFSGLKNKRSEVLITRPQKFIVNKILCSQLLIWIWASIVLFHMNNSYKGTWNVQLVEQFTSTNSVWSSRT